MPSRPIASKSARRRSVGSTGTSSQARRSGGQPLAPLGSTTSEHATTTLGRHPSHEAMLALARALLGLIRPLHGCVPFPRSALTIRAITHEWLALRQPAHQNSVARSALRRILLVGEGWVKPRRSPSSAGGGADRSVRTSHGPWPARRIDRYMHQDRTGGPVRAKECPIDRMPFAIHLGRCTRARCWARFPRCIATRHARGAPRGVVRASPTAINRGNAASRAAPVKLLRSIATPARTHASRRRAGCRRFVAPPKGPLL